MLLITITRWRDKLGLLLRLALFLALIGLVIPHCLNLIAERIAGYRSRGEEGQPPALRVEQRSGGYTQQHRYDEGFLKSIQEFYHDRER